MSRYRVTELLLSGYGRRFYSERLGTVRDIMRALGGDFRVERQWCWGGRWHRDGGNSRWVETYPMTTAPLRDFVARPDEDPLPVHRVHAATRDALEAAKGHPQMTELMMTADDDGGYWEQPRYNILGSPRYAADWEARYHALEDAEAARLALPDLTEDDYRWLGPTFNRLADAGFTDEVRRIYGMFEILHTRGRPL